MLNIIMYSARQFPNPTAPLVILFPRKDIQLPHKTGRFDGFSRKWEQNTEIGIHPPRSFEGTARLDRVSGANAIQLLSRRVRDRSPTWLAICSCFSEKSGMSTIARKSLFPFTIRI